MWKCEKDTKTKCVLLKTRLVFIEIKIVFILFKIILEFENIKQDYLKGEAREKRLKTGLHNLELLEDTVGI